MGMEGWDFTLKPRWSCRADGRVLDVALLQDLTGQDERRQQAVRLENAQVLAHGKDVGVQGVCGTLLTYRAGRRQCKAAEHHVGACVSSLGGITSGRLLCFFCRVGLHPPQPLLVWHSQCALAKNKS